MSRRTRAALALAAAALLGGSGCTTAQEEQARLNGEAAACPVDPDPSVRSSVRIGWQAIPNGDLIVQERQLLESCLPNATIQWVQFDGGDDVVQAFGSGSIDIGISGSSAAVTAMSPPLELPVRLVWIADVIGTSEALVSRDPAITTLEDLRGKKVAVTFGATPHYSLLSSLQAAGIEDEVVVVNLTNQAIPAAWERGEIDAVWTWEPTLSELMVSDGHVVMTSEQSAQQGHPTFDLISARAEFVEAEPELMTMWTRLQDHAATEIAEDPDAAAESMAVMLGTDPATVREQMEGYSYPDAAAQAGPDYFGGGVAGSLHSTAGFLGEVGLTDGASSEEHYEQIVHPDAIEEVAAS